jgi:hypothetical protein
VKRKRSSWFAGEIIFMKSTHAPENYNLSHRGVSNSDRTNERVKYHRSNFPTIIERFVKILDNQQLPEISTILTRSQA